MIACRCDDIPILWAADADAYAVEHLVREESGEDGVRTLRCPAGGRRWRQDHPRGADGVRTLRLRWLDLSPSDVVGYLNSCASTPAAS